MHGELESAAFIGALSTRASSDPSHGHYFWTYRAMHEHQSSRGLRIPTVIGPKESHTNFIEPVLTRNLSKKEFRVDLYLPFRYGIGGLSKLVKTRRTEGVHHYFSYDGGLSDYLITYWLALRNPLVFFTFNFHWADQWIALVTSTRISGILTRALLKKSLRNAPSNARFSAETKPFAEELSSVLGHNFSVFPIFSTNVPEKIPSWNTRSIDVLFLPQRRTEMDFVARASSALAETGAHVLTALKSDTWTRWPSRQDASALGEPLFLPLEAKAYEELLLSSRVVVLPYDKPYFRWGSSGKFNEAIAHGCFPVVPRRTAISSQSSGESSLHEFSYPDEHSLVDLVSRVLPAPAPDTLSPVLLKDFFQWMTSTKTPQTADRSYKRVVLLVILFLASSLYREVGLIQIASSLLKWARAKFKGR